MASRDSDSASASSIPGTSIPSNINTQPSQLHGHLEYARGLVSSTIGRATGLPSWEESGQATQESARLEMRAAKEKADIETAIARENDEISNESNKSGNAGLLKAGGNMERTIGRVVGCQGLVEDGEEKIKSGDRRV